MEIGIGEGLKGSHDEIYDQELNKLKAAAVQNGTELEDEMRKAIVNRFSTTPLWLGAQAQQFIQDKIDDINKAINVLNNLGINQVLLADMYFPPRPIQPYGLPNSPSSSSMGGGTKNSNSNEAQDLINQAIARIAIAQYNISEINNMFVSRNYKNALLAKDDINAGKDYLDNDDGEAYKYNGQFKGRLLRFSQDILPFWARQITESAGHSEWNNFAQQMYALQNLLYAHAQEVRSILEDEGMVYIAIDNMKKYGNSNAAVVFQLTGNVLNRRLASETNLIVLLNQTISLLQFSLSNYGYDYTGLPIIPIQRTPDQDKETDPRKRVYTIAESRAYWASDDRDPTQDKPMGRLQRIDEGIKYIDKITQGPRLSDTAKALFLALKANLQAERNYYDNHAKPEIDADEAFQKGNPNNESVLQVKARKLAARNVELLLYTNTNSPSSQDPSNPAGRKKSFWP